MHALCFTRSVNRDVRMGGSGGTSSRGSLSDYCPGGGWGGVKPETRGPDVRAVTILKFGISHGSRLLFSSSCLPLEAKTVTLRGMRLHRAFEQPLRGVLAKINVSSHWCDSECLNPDSAFCPPVHFIHQLASLCTATTWPRDHLECTKNVDNETTTHSQAPTIPTHPVHLATVFWLTQNYIQRLSKATRRCSRRRSPGTGHVFRIQIS